MSSSSHQIIYLKDFYMSDSTMMNTNVVKLTEICFRILLCLFGILGNSSLFFFTVPIGNRRIEPYKILLLNLALSNLLTNCMVDIPSILVEIYGTWFLGDVYCKIFWFMGSLSTTNSVLTTLAMSIFWFQKLVGNRMRSCPVLQSMERRSLRIFVSVGWLISATFSLPLLFFCSMRMMKSEDKELKEQKPPQNIFGCQDDFPSRSQKNVYEILYLVLANALPVLGMFIVNVKIIIFLIRNRKRVSTLKGLKSTGTSLAPNCGERRTTACQLIEGGVGSELVSCTSSVPQGLEFGSTQTIWTTSEDPIRDHIKGNHMEQLKCDLKNGEEQKHPPTGMNYNFEEGTLTAGLYTLNVTRIVLAPETDVLCTGDKICIPVEVCPESFTCSEDQCKLENPCDKIPEHLKSLDTKSRLVTKTLTRYPSVTTQIRAVLSIMAVVGVFLVFWVAHLTLRIKEDTDGSLRVIDNAGLIAASYTTIIPYIFIYSMKKCPCG